MKTLKSIVPFALACFAVFLFGGLFRPGEWYESLNRAPWSPPNIAFPIVWTILYICIAIVGYRICQSKADKLLKIWWFQLAINGLWSWIFFGQHWPLLGLVDITILSLLVGYLIVGCWRANIKSASYLLAPYLAWLILATSLNAYVVMFN